MGNRVFSPYINFLIIIIFVEYIWDLTAKNFGKPQIVTLKMSDACLLSKSAVCNQVLQIEQKKDKTKFIKINFKTK